MTTPNPLQPTNIPTPSLPSTGANLAPDFAAILGGLGGGMQYGTMDRQLPTPTPVPFVPMHTAQIQVPGNATGRSASKISNVNALMSQFTNIANDMGKLEYARKLSEATNNWKVLHQALESGDQGAIYSILKNPKIVKDMNEALALHLMNPEQANKVMAKNHYAQALRQYVQKFGLKQAQMQNLQKELYNRIALGGNAPNLPPTQQIQRAADLALIRGNASPVETAVAFGIPVQSLVQQAVDYRTKLIGLQNDQAKITSQIQRWNQQNRQQVQAVNVQLAKIPIEMKTATAAVMRGKGLIERGQAAMIEAQVEREYNNIRAYTTKWQAFGRVVDNDVKTYHNIVQRMEATAKAAGVKSNIDVFIYSRQAASIPGMAQLQQKFHQIMNKYTHDQAAFRLATGVAQQRLSGFGQYLENLRQQQNPGTSVPNTPQPASPSSSIFQDLDRLGSGDNE